VVPRSVTINRSIAPVDQNRAMISSSAAFAGA